MHFELFSVRISGMKTKTAKGNIKRLLKYYGTKERVAKRLGISVRYVEMLEAGDKAPGASLRKLIKIMAKGGLN